MTSREALNSSDPRVVKTARRAIKGQITIATSQSSNLLHKKSDGDFKLNEVSEIHSKLKSNFELINQLHDRYVQVRDEGQDDDEENRLVEEEVR